jgi:hypothetical protein
MTPPAVAPIAPPVTGGSNFLNSLLPGFNNLTTSATGDIQSLLNGLPSPSQARTTNAYWGAGAGTPAGGAGTTGDINSFIGARGTDLYGQQAAANQQTGLQDLLQTIGTYSAPALQAQGQANQVNQFGQNLAQQGSQFGQNLTVTQQQQAFDQAQKAYQTSPEYLTMLENLKNYGTQGAPNTAGNVYGAGKTTPGTPTFQNI